MSRTSITIPTDVYEAGLRNAATRGHLNSFSAYLAVLIKEDDEREREAKKRKAKKSGG